MVAKCQITTWQWPNYYFGAFHRTEWATFKQTNKLNSDFPTFKCYHINPIGEPGVIHVLPRLMLKNHRNCIPLMVYFSSNPIPVHLSIQGPVADLSDLSVSKMSSSPQVLSSGKSSPTGNGKSCGGLLLLWLAGTELNLTNKWIELMWQWCSVLLWYIV